MPHLSLQDVPWQASALSYDVSIRVIFFNMPQALRRLVERSQEALHRLLGFSGTFLECTVRCEPSAVAQQYRT
ncbi:hypothetical protein BJS_05685 [Bradyrhizobium japonicum SEMIA 5079]|nr:hypothetical protein BJS_05685 [Bradyrhizobium japonicum SEMIA 5079]